MKIFHFSLKADATLPPLQNNDKRKTMTVNKEKKGELDGLGLQSREKELKR